MRLSALALLSFLALPAAAEEPLPSCQLLLDSDLAASRAASF